MREASPAAMESTHTIAPDLRAFDGHFPGAPVLPGAYLLALVLHEIGRHDALRAPSGVALQVQQVKFLAPVGPGSTLRIHLQSQGDAIAFAVHEGATPVARGQVSRSEVPLA
jgi:3-hydroxymyristoyl/3-hydroxydecanoyl-(acyl carrier protein) dehydratase